ncbi:hypothetical protein L3X38_043030 [Prunus dulcis]|uniref:Uncharacterized protein n=1 Tax=Prunus dulcis TaxID=3755 RepID=A0AAD4YM39_PRUDU|nr:hypothetical protein L3X38_043030 [Prunus dulcis]
MDPNLHESATPRQPPHTATEAVTLFSCSTMASATVQAVATIPPAVSAFETIALEPADVASHHGPMGGSTLHRLRLEQQCTLDSPPKLPRMRPWPC